MKSINNIFRNIGFGIKVSYKASPFYFTIKCLILLINTITPLISLAIWRNIINIIASTMLAGKIVIFLAIYFCLKLLVYLTAKLNNYVIVRYYDARTFYIENIMLKSIAHIDLAYFESSSFSDKLNHIRKSFGALHDTAWVVFDVIAGVINVVLTFLIISNYNIWLGLIILVLLVPYYIYNQHFTYKMFELRKKQTRDNRMKSYCDSVFFNNTLLFELKLNKIGQFFIDKSNSVFENLFLTNRKENQKHTIINSLFIILSYMGELLMLLLSINDVINRTIGIGDLQYNLNICNRLHSQMMKLMNDINVFVVNNTQINELKEFMNMAPKHTSNGKIILHNNPKIEFCNVSFKYPNTDNYVLKNCSFIIAPNEKIGLIGLNGAGKSTIIKLMFRFYDPEEGCIKLNGVDLKEYDIYAVRKVFGVLFQDYVTYCLPLREIIALSDFDERFSDEKLKKACDISGASEVIKDWENGFDSVLGRYYADNGKDLSGGQWQLVGLARAYFKDCEYMILDEPSAALDPISEDRIFEQLYHLSGEKASVTISHRLSNTILADKILVIDDGHIIEQGSHFELLKQNGEYARLFHLQASKYR